MSRSISIWLVCVCLLGAVSACERAHEGSEALATEGPASPDPPTDPTSRPAQSPSSRPTTGPSVDPALDRPVGRYSVERMIGRAGAEPGELDTPMGLAIDPEGRLYVADTGNARVQILAPDGAFVASLGDNPNGPRLRRPMDVALAADGSVWVADFAQNEIFRFSPEGSLVERRGQGQLSSPAGIAIIGPDRIAVAEFYGHRVRVFDGEGSSFLSSEGHEPGQLYYPTDLTVFEGGDLLVADTYNHRVQRLRLDGTPVAVWRGPPGRLFDAPVGIAVTEGAIHVADSANRRVVALDASGELLAEWTLIDDRRPEVYSPSRVEAHDGLVYVTDAANHRIVVLRPLLSEATSQ